MYSFLFKIVTEIPITRKLSYSEFCKSGRKSEIQFSILNLLVDNPKGLTCRQLSSHGNIWVQSLTSPLKKLLETGEIEVIGIRKSSVSNRLVQVYGITNLNVDSHE